MEKSLGNAIYLSDTVEDVNRKVMSAVTDPNRIKKDDKKEIQIYVWFHIIINYLVLKKSVEMFVKNVGSWKRGCVACKSNQHKI